VADVAVSKDAVRTHVVEAGAAKTADLTVTVEILRREVERHFRNVSGQVFNACLASSA
jgi:hypothetical protein